MKRKAIVCDIDKKCFFLIQLKCEIGYADRKEANSLPSHIYITEFCTKELSYGFN